MGNSSVYQPVPLRHVWRELGGGDIRRGRGQAFWRDSHDWNISIDLDRNLYCDHARATGGGPVSLVMQVLDFSAHDAGRWLREHFGGPLAEGNHCAAYRVSDRDELAEAETIRVALAWHIETQLEIVKVMLWGPCHQRAALRVRRLTVQLGHVHAWTPAQAVSRLRRLGRSAPAYVTWLYGEAEELQIALARAIAGAAA